MQTARQIVASEIQLRCEACGAAGKMTRETGPVEPRASAWTNAHLAPVLLALHAVNLVTGDDLGWWNLQ